MDQRLVDERPPAELLDTSAAGPAAIRGSALRVSGYLAGVVLSVGSATLLVRHLGVVDFGRYATVMSLITICAGVTDLGMTTIGMREYSTLSGEARERALRGLLGVRVAATSTGVLVATLFALVAGYASVLVVGTLVAGVGLALQMVQNFYAVPLGAGLQLGRVTTLELARQGIAVGGIAALVAAGAGLLPFLAVPILAALITLALTYRFVRGRVPFRPAFERGELRRLLAETVPFSAATAAYVIYFRVAIILMSLIATAVETGYFATSFRIIEVLVAVPSLVIGSVFPVLARAARDSSARFAYAITRTIETSAIAGVWLSLAVALGAPTAIAVIAGPRFAPSVPVLRIQAVALTGTFVTVAVQFGLLSLRRYRALLAADLAALPVAALAVVILVNSDGARGAAIAMTGVELALAAVSLALMAHAGANMAFLRRLLPRLAFAAAPAAAAQLLPVPPLVRVLIATVVYVGVLALVKGIPADLWSAFLARWRVPPQPPASG